MSVNTIKDPEAASLPYLCLLAQSYPASASIYNRYDKAAGIMGTLQLGVNFINLNCIVRHYLVSVMYTTFTTQGQQNLVWC